MSTVLERLNAAVAAVAPIHGCAILPAGTTPDPGWHVVTNNTTGTATLIRIDYQAAATPGQIADGDAVAIAFDLTGGTRRPRSVFAIYADLTGLTATQQDAVIADLQVTSLSGKWTGLRPPQDAPAAAFRWSAVSLAGATAGEKRQAAGWIAAMWCQQNPAYLTTAPFAFGIPGDEPTPP